MKKELVVTAIALALGLLLLCISAPYSEAETLPFDLVVVQRNEISTQDQINLFYEGVARLKEVGVFIKVTSIREVPDYLQKNEYKDYVNRLFDWVSWSNRNGYRNKKRHIHFLLPPVLLNGVNYQGGVAGAMCTTNITTSRNFSYSIMRNKSDTGLDRRKQSVIAVAHEILHNLGAGHRDSSANVMHSAALNFADNYLPILSYTQRQVNWCRQGRTSKGRKTRSFISSYDKPFV